MNVLAVVPAEVSGKMLVALTHIILPVNQIPPAVIFAQIALIALVTLDHIQPPALIADLQLMLLTVIQPPSNAKMVFV